MSGTIIVGASVGGIRVAQGLRAAGYDRPITLVDHDTEAPYDKPPLSKQVMQADGAAPPQLVEAGLAELGALRSGVAAVGLDPDQRLITLANGERLDFENLVIATGSRPRTLPFASPDIVRYLRTYADARRLRDDLGRARRLVVIGGGFVGTEVASAARARGVEVTIVEAGSRLAARALPRAPAQHLAALHQAAGHEVTFNRHVAGVEVAGRSRVVVLDDGRRLACDLVLVGIGAEPATSWLVGSGLKLDDGVVCSETLLASRDSPIYAIGDVARWWNPAYERLMRLEHWSATREQATIVAANIAHGTPIRSAAVVPYVWSDQLGVHFQQVGDDRLDDVVVEQTTAGPANKGLLFRYLRSGRVVGATGFDAQREIALIRRDLCTSWSRT
ncbi:FAD-dependent oxidoreductase [Nocardioides sp. NBC_00163]|uniref:NAD(P)/FAD-dependent oxidoreductase n=1 Tax=Nocardioides sp. NBC_00163 TaxID=2975999 RepID=UPI0032456467